MPCRHKQIQKREPILHGPIQKHGHRRLPNIHLNLSADFELLRDCGRTHLHVLPHVQQQSNEPTQKSKAGRQDNDHCGWLGRLGSRWHDVRPNSHSNTIFRGFRGRSYRWISGANWKQHYDQINGQRKFQEFDQRTEGHHHG